MLFMLRALHAWYAPYEVRPFHLHRCYSHVALKIAVQTEIDMQLAVEGAKVKPNLHSVEQMNEMQRYVAHPLPIKACVIESRTKIDRRYVCAHSERLMLHRIESMCVCVRAAKHTAILQVSFLFVARPEVMVQFVVVYSFVWQSFPLLCVTLKTCRPIREQIRRNNCIFQPDFSNRSVWSVSRVAFSRQKCRGSPLRRLNMCILYPFRVLQPRCRSVCKCTQHTQRTKWNCMQKVTAAHVTGRRSLFSSLLFFF